MNKLAIIFTGIFIPIASYAVPATVEYVFDGDTFAAKVKLEDDIKISVRVRILDIDAPEINGKCDSEIKAAKSAKNRLQELLPLGSTIELYEIKDDKYLGRIDAHVKTSSGVNVSDVMIKEKLVRKYGGGHRFGWCE